MKEEVTVKLMLQSALPIDDIDQIAMLPGRTLVLVWVDVQDRPDLADLAARHGQGASTFLMTWFAANPGARNMIIGLRVEMETATRVVFHLAFKVERYLPELEILAQSGHTPSMILKKQRVWKRIIEEKGVPGKAPLAFTMI